MKKGFVRAAAAPGAKSVLILEAPASSSLPASPQVQQQPLSCEAVRGGWQQQASAFAVASPVSKFELEAIAKSEFWKQKARGLLGPEVIPQGLYQLPSISTSGQAEGAGLSQPPTASSFHLLSAVNSAAGGKGDSRVDGFPQESCHSWNPVLRLPVQLPDPASARLALLSQEYTKGFYGC